MRNAATNLGNQPLAAGCPSVLPHHFRRDRRFVDEHEARRIERRLLGLQLGACRGDVRSILLGGVQEFF
jgi:hypothetical protein